MLEQNPLSMVCRVLIILSILRSMLSICLRKKRKENCQILIFILAMFSFLDKEMHI